MRLKPLPHVPHWKDEVEGPLASPAPEAPASRFIMPSIRAGRDCGVLAFARWRAMLSMWRSRRRKRKRGEPEDRGHRASRTSGAHVTRYKTSPPVDSSSCELWYSWRGIESLPQEESGALPDLPDLDTILTVRGNIMVPFTVLTNALLQ